MPTTIEPVRPGALAGLDVSPRGRVQPSPISWRDQVIYFLLPDRFSDGQEAGRPRFDRAQPQQFRAPDTRAWMEAGRRFQGGTLRGIASNLDYLRILGVTTLWISPDRRPRDDGCDRHPHRLTTAGGSSVRRSG